MFITSNTQRSPCLKQVAGVAFSFSHGPVRAGINYSWSCSAVESLVKLRLSSQHRVAQRFSRRSFPLRIGHFRCRMNWTSPGEKTPGKSNSFGNGLHYGISLIICSADSASDIEGELWYQKIRLKLLNAACTQTTSAIETRLEAFPKLYHQPEVVLRRCVSESRHYHQGLCPP